MRSLFVVWNRGYKQIQVIANDAAEALRIALECGHIKRLDGYRKLRDQTQETLAKDDALAMALQAGRSGVATRGADGWLIAGEPTGD